MAGMLYDYHIQASQVGIFYYHTRSWNNFCIWHKSNYWIIFLFLLMSPFVFEDGLMSDHLFWSVWIEFWSFLFLILNNSVRMSHVWVHSSFWFGDTRSLGFFEFHMIPTCVFLQKVCWTHSCRHLFNGDSYFPVICSSLCRILLSQHFRTVE
jgi:hypothetical protein